MGIWSSIREFYQTWKPEIHLYGIGFLLMVSGLLTGKWVATCLVFTLLLIMDVMRRWGEPWRQIGEKEMERRRLASRQAWQERLHEWTQRLRGEPPIAAAAQPAEDVSPPRGNEEDLPESPAPIRETEKPPAPVLPPVTHDT